MKAGTTMALSEDGLQRFVDVEPHIDYLAKDYASFRQLMLDHLSVLVPTWQEDSPADLGNVLIEVLAYAADYLSYFQDSVGTEAYLGTARLRRSIRRHARLLDYFMHEGCNARVWVQIAVNQASVTLNEDTLLLTHLPGLPMVINATEYEDALQRTPQVFATLHQARLFGAHNTIPFYTENPRTNAILPAGTTRALLQRSFSRQESTGKKSWQVDHLQPGDVLIFDEIRHPQTGRPQLDPKRRHAVRLVKVSYHTQPPGRSNATGMPPIEIEWAEADALPFALHIAPYGSQQEPVSVAHGNIVLADHGRWIVDEQLPVVTAQSRYRPRLRQPDLTYREAYDPAQAAAQPATATLQQNPRFAMPVIQLYQKDSKVTMAADKGALLPTVQHALQVDWRTRAQAMTTKPDAVRRPWQLRRDLLNSDRFSLDYVVEMEEGTRAALRFGFGDLGKVPIAGDEFVARYRIGNGIKGNIGPDTIHHLVEPGLANLAAQIERIWNPLPAQNGIDPELLEEVRIHAPYAYKEQEVCVIAADYAAVAMRYPGVYQATAVIQWIGTWQTVQLYVRRADFQPISPAFRQRLRSYLEPFRYMGHELLICDPRLVPLEVALLVTLEPGQQPLVVQSALNERLSAQRYGTGERGFFHPANFAFGQSVFQSKLVAAAMAVPGVASVIVKRFRRTGQAEDSDEIQLEPLEVAQLQELQIDLSKAN